jgi:hypothetical protein
MVQGADRRIIIHRPPIPAQLPRAKGDLADLPASSAKSSVLHQTLLLAGAL